MNLQEIEKWLHEKTRAAAEKWFIEQCQNSFASFYLYYKAGDITISQDTPGEEWHLATPQRISRAMSMEQVKYSILETLSRCPCLPVNESSARGR